MIEKVLIPLHGEYVAPRFDLATEAVVAAFGEGGEPLEERTIVLPQASSDELCRLALAENVKVVICGGIEEEYHQYLSWKQIEVIDSVVASASAALRCHRSRELKAGDVLRAPEEKPSEQS